LFVEYFCIEFEFVFIVGIIGFFVFFIVCEFVVFRVVVCRLFGIGND